jgi:hypothetical protein
VCVDLFSRLAAALLVAAFIGMVQQASEWTRLLGISSELALYALTIAVAVPTVFHRMSAGRDALFGFSWAGLYGLLIHLSPGALGASLGTATSDTELIYFSFVTLTTLGYGDFTPAINVAQSLATLQSLFGILFPAVLVARLVSLYR